MVHVTLSGIIQLEEIITFQNKVREVLHSEYYAPFFQASILTIKFEDVPTSELRG